MERRTIKSSSSWGNPNASAFNRSPYCTPLCGCTLTSPWRSD
ncbi:MAG: hypothetical protein ACI4SH_00355 [Candidatus Scatosoma sp.]